VFLAAAWAVSGLQPALSARFTRLQNRNDVYALPSPERVVLLSLGYRAALADYLFAHVLVYYGIHFQERRRFEFVGEYLDTIVTLDPKYLEAYRFADTLLTLSAEPPRPEDYRKVRELLERGMEQFPHDGDLWLTAGQFLAYVGPARFPDEATKREWRLAGARRLAHACELVGDDVNLPHHCITAAGLLSREGEREAMIEFLERVMVVNDDPEILGIAQRALQGYHVDRARLAVARRSETLDQMRRQHYPLLDKDSMLVLAPPFEAASCAGVPAPATQSCATSWRRWAQASAQ
jgi:tetratricopeptide (TPR) repeat protein